MGKRYQRESAPQQPAAAPTPKPNYLDLLIQKHEQALRDRHAGIDYQAVLAAAGLGRTDKPCFQCGAKEHVVKVKFKDGSFSGNLCMTDLYARIPAEQPKAKSDVQGSSNS
jgi:hypothetical protein